MSTTKKNGNGKTPARTRTRVETAAAFDDLQTSVTTTERVDPKTSAAQAAHRMNILGTTGTISQESVVKMVSDLTLGVSKQLAGLQESLLERVRERDELDEAISAKKEELEALHGKDIAASAIDDLIADYAEKKAAFEKETNDRFALWAKQDEERRAAAKLEADKLTNERARERDAYEYAKNVERRNAEDAFKQQLDTQKRAQALASAELERKWAEREAELDKRETELAELRAKVAGFDEVLKTAVDKQVAIVASSVKRDLGHTFELEKKDLLTQLTIANSRITAAEEAVGAKEQTIVNLQSSLNAATQRVAEMANKALESASGREAMARVQETLSTQAGPKKG